MNSDNKNAILLAAKKLKRANKPSEIDSAEVGNKNFKGNSAEEDISDRVKNAVSNLKKDD